jgi:dTDP-glucose 4,6-dehydratase
MVNHLLTWYPQYRVVNLDKMTYCSNPLNIDKKFTDDPRYTFVQGDICDHDTVMDILVTHDIDTVIHYAAESHVDNSFNNSLVFTHTNIFGTHNLLQCSLESKNQIKRFIHVSTDEVYGETVDNPGQTVEQTMLNPTNPYASTKAAAEFIVKGYVKSFKLPVIITRGNNVYGPGQYPEKVIPKFISRLRNGMPCTIHGGGHSRRSFMHVNDVVAAFDNILHRGKVGEIYNIGVDTEYSILNVADRLRVLFNKEDIPHEYVRDRSFNDHRYYIDSNKLKKLGWKENTTLEEGLKETCDWYIANMDEFWDKTVMAGALQAHPTVK